MADKTILDYDPAENISKSDILYLIQGVLANRDRQVTLGEVIPELYDYVVDSDAKLQALCDGTVADAYAVFIAEGSWTATEGSAWDLTTTGTFKVVGHRNSILNFSGAVDALTGTTVSGDFLNKSFDNVHVVMNSGASTSGYMRGFVSCFNIKNCTVDLTGANAAVTAGGFFGSLNLSDCDVSISGTCTVGAYYLYTGMASTAVGIENKYGVYNCNLALDVTSSPTIEGFTLANKLENCHVQITNAISSGDIVIFGTCNYIEGCTIYSVSTLGASSHFYGFNNCTYISNISIDGDFYGSVDSAGSMDGFTSCNYVSNFYISLSASLSCKGFSSCNNVSNGVMSVQGASGYVNCFSSCKNVTNIECTLRIAGGTVDYRAFYDCDSVSCCRIILFVSSASTGDMLGMINCTYLTNIRVEENGGAVDGFENCEHMSVCSGLITGTLNIGCGYYDTDTCFV